MTTAHEDPFAPSCLTPRERQVMEYVALGAPNKAIARALNLSRRTVEHYRANVFHKLGVDNAIGLLHLLQGNTKVNSWRARLAVQQREACNPLMPYPPRAAVPTGAAPRPQCRDERP